MLQPFSDPDTDREIRRASRDGNAHRPVGVHDIAEKSALLGLDDHALRARCRGLDLEAVVLQIFLYVRLQSTEIGPLALEVLDLVTQHRCLLRMDRTAS